MALESTTLPSNNSDAVEEFQVKLLLEDGERENKKDNFDGTNLNLLTGVDIRIPVPWGFIAGKEWGNRNGYPVLGLHGWMDNAGTFDKLAPLLSQSLRFIAVELPGHGFSSHLPPGLDYTFLDFVMVIRRIVKFFEWSKFSIIGHSMGASVGLVYASVFPNEIQHLVLLDLLKPLTRKQSGQADLIRRSINITLAMEDKINPVPPTYSYFDALTRLKLATHDNLTDESARILLLRGTRQVDEEKFCYTRDVRLQNVLPIIQLKHDDSFDILSSIRCRILYIKPEISLDYLDKPKLVEQTVNIYKEQAAEFKVVNVSGTHFFHLNDPTETVGLINEFILKESKSKL